MCIGVDRPLKMALVDVQLKISKDSKWRKDKLGLLLIHKVKNDK